MIADNRVELVLTTMQARDLRKLIAPKIKHSVAHGDRPYWQALDTLIATAMEPAEGIAALRRSASWEG